MKLAHDPFIQIWERRKQIEFRLYDEKRQQIELGDIIIFNQIDRNTIPKETLQVEVIGLYHSRSFLNLFNSLDKATMGWNTENMINEKIWKMRTYYSTEDESKYGVLGIHIKILVNS